MDEAIQFLLTLQSYDMRLAELTQLLENVPQRKATLAADMQKWEQNFAQLKIQLQNLKLETQQLETTLRCCEAALRENQRKLTFTPNPKEYKNLEQKIAVEEQKIAQLEELWLNKTLEMESKEAELAGLQQTSNGEAQKLQEEWNRQEQYSQNLEGNRAELRGKIEAMRKIVKESHNHWLRPYDETKKAVRKMPCIVELRGGNFCGGCNLKLSDYSNLTANPQFPFAVCESCARLILLQDKT